MQVFPLAPTLRLITAVHPSLPDFLFIFARRTTNQILVTSAQQVGNLSLKRVAWRRISANPNPTLGGMEEELLRVLGTARQ